MSDIFLIKRHLVTEKSTGLHKLGKYVFVVKTSATKPEVKKLVKELYRVDAVDVHMINIPPKTKRYRNIAGPRGGHKKAIVTLKKGQTIDTE